jgi:hypothetical protein
MRSKFHRWCNIIGDVAVAAMVSVCAIGCIEQSPAGRKRIGP